MGILFKKDKAFALTKIGWLAVTTAVIGLSASFVDTIWAVYMNSFVQNIAVVGFISAFLTLVSFLSFFFIVPVVEKSSKSKLFSLTLILFGISYAFFAINKNFYIFIILATIISVLINLRITCLGIIIRDKSSERQLSRNEGLNYVFLNLSWLIGPLIAGYFSEKYNFNFIFLLSAIFIFIAFLFFKMSNIKDVNIKKKIDKNILKNFSDFFKNRDRTLAYIIGGGVNLWWVLIYLFIPLFIIENGLEIQWVGYFLFAVAIPLVLFEYYFAKLAGKIGFKKIFRIGFFIPFFLSLLCFFIGNIYMILFLLSLASIGLAMLGATTEAYFFDNIKGKQELRFYGPYNTAIDVNHFMGKIITSLILLFLPFKSIFLLYSLFMLIMLLFSFKVKNIIEERRDGKLN